MSISEKDVLCSSLCYRLWISIHIKLWVHNSWTQHHNPLGVFGQMLQHYKEHDQAYRVPENFDMNGAHPIQLPVCVCLHPICRRAASCCCGVNMTCFDGCTPSSPLFPWRVSYATSSPGVRRKCRAAIYSTDPFDGSSVSCLRYVSVCGCRVLQVLIPVGLWCIPAETVFYNGKTKTN